MSNFVSKLVTPHSNPSILSIIGTREEVWRETSYYGVSSRVSSSSKGLLIKRFDKGDTLKALQKAVEIIKKRSTYIRGMNIIMVNDGGIYASTFFNEDEEYFTIRYKEGKELRICSEPYPSEEGWQRMANGSTRVW